MSKESIRDLFKKSVKERKARDSEKDPKKKPSASSSRGKNPEITDPVKIEFEPSMDDLIGSMDESFDGEFVGMLNEVLTIAGRLKRRQQIRRYKARMNIARKRSMKRRATQSRISSRARRSAISAVKKKLAGGRSTRNLSFSERARVEKLAKRRKALVNRQTRRLIIQKRAQERRRLSGRRR